MTIQNELQGKVAIVTGATRGMGEAIALLYAKQGCRVVATGRNSERGKALEQQARQQQAAEATGGLTFVPADLMDPAAGQLLVSEAVRLYGGVDIVVANAGELGLGRADELTDQQWRQTIGLNLDAIFYLCRAAIPQLQKKSASAIVINGSIAAWKGFPGHAAYCASKSALVGLTHQLARDYGRDQIRVNMMAPGPIDTPLLRESVVAFPNPETILEETASGTAIGRIGQPQDVAELALFLASNRSSYITGAVIPIDGGISAG